MMLSYHSLRIGFMKLFKNMRIYTRFQVLDSEDYMLKCFTHVKKENTRVIHHMAHSELTQFFNKKNASESILKIVSCGSVGVSKKTRGVFKSLINSIERS